MLMKGSRLPVMQAEVFSSNSIESSSTCFPRHLIAFTISEQTGFAPGVRGECNNGGHPCLLSLT